jgi:oligogalacturonide lyase
MKTKIISTIGSVLFMLILIRPSASGQIGTRFPSEKKIVTDPVTGTILTFLTSNPAGDSKIYQTHNQWTADGNWVVFRSNRVRGEAMAVNENTGVIVQVSEGGFSGMLNVARKSMKLVFMRNTPREPGSASRSGGPVQVVEVDLGKLFTDSEAGKLKPASEYQRVCGTTPAEMGAGGDMALDALEDVVYFRVGKEESARNLPAGTKINSNFGPRNMGAGPTGLGSMNLKTGETKFIIAGRQAEKLLSAPGL